MKKMPPWLGYRIFLAEYTFAGWFPLLGLGPCMGERLFINLKSEFLNMTFTPQRRFLLVIVGVTAALLVPVDYFLVHPADMIVGQHLLISTASNDPAELSTADDVYVDIRDCICLLPHCVLFQHPSATGC